MTTDSWTDVDDALTHLHTAMAAEHPGTRIVAAVGDAAFEKFIDLYMSGFASGTATTLANLHQFRGIPDEVAARIAHQATTLAAAAARDLAQDSRDELTHAIHAIVAPDDADDEDEDEDEPTGEFPSPAPDMDATILAAVRAFTRALAPAVVLAPEAEQDARRAQLAPLIAALAHAVGHTFPGVAAHLTAEDQERGL